MGYCSYEDYQVHLSFAQVFACATTPIAVKSCALKRAAAAGLKAQNAQPCSHITSAVNIEVAWEASGN